ncbi:MAG: lamin tail domain-containing protein [Actinomycetes bacterium]
MAGAQGPPGAAGPTGPQGEAGPALSSLDDLTGAACDVGGAAGTLAITSGVAGHITLTCVAGSSASPGKVRINEVATGTSGAAADEFVEISNSGGTSVDIGGWKIVYRSASGTSDVTLVTIPTGVTLAPGGYYLGGGSAYAGAQTADQSFSTGLAATGGAVGLRDGSAALIDGVGWGTATNALVESGSAPAPPATASPGSSLVRLPDGHDTDDNAVDFSVSATPTPRAANH